MYAERRTRTALNPMMPKVSQTIPPGICWSSKSSVLKNSRAISDQTTTASSPRATTTLRELEATVKNSCKRGAAHNFLPQMCVNGADKRRFPQKSLYDGCRGCLTRPSFALSLGGSREYGDDVDESTLEIEPLKDMDADKLRADGMEVSKI